MSQQPAGGSRGPMIAIAAGIAVVAGVVGGLVGGVVSSGRSSSSGAPAASGSSASVCNAVTVSSTVLPSLVQVVVQSGKLGATGSGSVIDGEGDIITNNHVVDVGSNPTVTVNFSRGRSNVPATVLGRDPLTDVAVIKVGQDAGKLNPIHIGSSAGLVVGQPVVALGAPLGLTDTVTSGIVSALDRVVNVGSQNSPTILLGAIQTDASVNPGNSGGPLVDCESRQVGINSAGASPAEGGGGGSVGLNFAIPMDFAMSLAKEIIATGSATHPSIGILGASVTEEVAKATGLPRGVYVESVLRPSPAATAGLRTGDVITQLAGKPVPTMSDYLVVMREQKIGSTVKVTYDRSGSSSTVDVQVVDARALSVSS